MLERIDEAGSRHHLETLVDANKKLGRNGRNLDSAELRTFDLPRDRTQLACRIDFALDAPAGIALYRCGKVLGELMRGVIDGRQRDLHDIGLVLGLRRSERQHERQDERASGSSLQRGFRIFPKTHDLLPLFESQLGLSFYCRGIAPTNTADTQR
jgi:hypothetical protein